jgi:hypothetical protein
MPNNITNKLVFEGTESEIKRLFETVISKRDSDTEEERDFLDFNKIIPQPKELEGTCSPVKIISEKEYKSEMARIKNGDLTQNEISFGLAMGITKAMQQDFMSKFGVDNWYDWRYMNWGTKWNSYENIISDNEIEFDTAWNSPITVIVALSKMFPTITMNLSYADEDLGYNCGTIKFLNGEMIEVNQPDGGSFEAYLLALEVKDSFEDYLTDILEEYFQDDKDSNITQNLMRVAVEKEFENDFYFESPELVHAMLEVAERVEKYEYAQVLTTYLKDIS